MTEKSEALPASTCSRCFPPVEPEQARILILGSFPGVRSLAAQQYYAHPRNSFWQIMSGLLGFASDLSYAERVAGLLENKVALWDVLACCERPGSLDADIDPLSIMVNDFKSLFSRHQSLQAIFFNGERAEREFRRRVLPELDCLPPGVTLKRLPSTSPAHAARGFAEKMAAWRVIVDYLEG